MKRLLWIPLLFLCLPAFGAITRDGSCAAASTTCTVGTGGSGVSANGDLVVIFAYRNASTTPPTLPGSNTNIATSSGGATNSFRVYCHEAAGTGDTTGSATNATGIVAIWYSGTGVPSTATCATQAVAIGVVASGNQQSGTSATTATYSGLTTSSGNTSSWIVGFMGDNVSSDDCTPTGMTLVTTNVGNVISSDTNAAVSSWAQATCSITSATYRTFTLEILAASPACSSCSPGWVQVVDDWEMLGVQSATGGTFEMAANDTLFIPFAASTQAGNALVWAGHISGTSLNLTVGDTASNSYYCNSHSDATNSETSYICVAPNARSVSGITMTASSQINDVYGAAIGEATNIATANPFDGTAGNSGTSTSVTGGSITPTVSGDFFIQAAVQDSSNASTCFTVGSQTNITWAFFAADCGMQGAMQSGVYSSTSALNSTMSQPGSNGFVSEVVALKGASAGSTPTAPYVTSMKHYWLTDTTSGNASRSDFFTSPRTEKFPCPASSNFMYIGYLGSATQSDTLTAVTDSNSQTWTATATAFSNETTIHNYYQASATTAPAQTITLTGSFTVPSAISYCLTGMSGYTFHSPVSGATNSGNQSSTGTTLAALSFTPGGNSGVIFAQTGVAFNTLNGLSTAGQLFDSARWSGQSLSNGGLDQNNGWGMNFFATNAAQSWTWTTVASSPAIGNWAAREDEFDAPAAGGHLMPPAVY